MLSRCNQARLTWTERPQFSGPGVGGSGSKCARETSLQQLIVREAVSERPQRRNATVCGNLQYVALRPLTELVGGDARLFPLPVMRQRAGRDKKINQRKNP